MNTSKNLLDARKQFFITLLRSGKNMMQVESQWVLADVAASLKASQDNLTIGNTIQLFNTLNGLQTFSKDKFRNRNDLTR